MGTVLLSHILKLWKHKNAQVTVLRTCLGYQFLHAGFEKITGGGFDASGFLKSAIASATGDHPAVQGW